MMWVDGRGELPGQLVVVSGPSGCGKSSVIRRVLDTSGLDLQLSISATDRDRRPGETHGVEYFFMETVDFINARNSDHFLETAIYNDRHYGTPKEPVYQSLAAGRSVLLEIEVYGALQVREKAPSVLFVFMRTPKFSDLEIRLRARGTESEPSIHRRLKTARHELAEAHWYDVQIINDDFDRCVEEFINVLKANGCGG